jgi:plastocyanin
MRRFPPAALAARAEVRRNISLMDACDPATFNAAVGPGACVRSGGMTFQRFLAELQAHGSVGAWHFAPTLVNARVGDLLLATNRGGEVHTFTEVEDFGGGIVPSLNQLSGNPTVAPECTALEADDFVAPGTTYSDEVEEAGTEKYQCCIHPWMRLVVNGR